MLVCCNQAANWLHVYYSMAQLKRQYQIYRKFKKFNIDVSTQYASCTSVMGKVVKAQKMDEQKWK